MRQVREPRDVGVHADRSHPLLDVAELGHAGQKARLGPDHAGMLGHHVAERADVLRSICGQQRVDLRVCVRDSVG